jgi:hypothetical protein
MPILRDHDGYFSTKTEREKKKKKLSNKFSDGLIRQSRSYLGYDGYWRHLCFCLKV